MTPTLDRRRRSPLPRTGRAGVGVAVLAVSLTACGDTGSAGPRPIPEVAFCQEVLPRVEAWVAASRSAHPTPDDPRYGGTLVAAGIAELSDGMNAAVSASVEAVQHQMFVNLMTLVRYDENLAPQPYLAESWEVADDLSSITFHIRRDVFWHDGEQTDAHDVAFTFRTVTNPETTFPNAAYWDSWDKEEGGVEVLDDFTIRMAMQPHADYLDPWRTVAILPEHLLGDVPPAELGQHPFGTVCPVGNGPFVFWSHAAQDRWVFEANPAFPTELGGRPFVDRYLWRVIPEQTTLLAELLTGGIDVYIRPAPDQLQRITDDPGTDLIRYVGRNYDFIGWNGLLPQFRDARVRRALTMSIDRSAIVDAVLQGYGTIAHSSVPPFHWAYDPSIEGVPYDPARARDLLAEAGWTDRDGDGVRENGAGVPLSFTIKFNEGSGTRADVSEIVQAQLSEVGIAVTLESVETGTLIDQLTTVREDGSRDFEALVLGWSTEFRLDDRDIFDSRRIRGPYAWSATSNPEIDRLQERLSTLADRDEARELWAQYQEVLIEEQPYTFLYYADRTAGIRTRVEGVRMDARGEWLSVRDWYLDPASR